MQDAHYAEGKGKEERQEVIDKGGWYAYCMPPSERVKEDHVHRPREDMHELALEACLAAYKMHLDKLRRIEKVLLKMRKKTRKKLRGKFSKREVATEGKVSREQYWKENGAPIAHKLDEGYARLMEQVKATHTVFPEISDDTRNTLINIMSESICETTESQHAAIGKLIAAWNQLMQKIQEVLEEGAEFLPSIQGALSAFRADIDATLAVI